MRGPYKWNGNERPRLDFFFLNNNFALVNVSPIPLAGRDFFDSNGTCLLAYLSSYRCLSFIVGSNDMQI